ncbi:MAG: dihydroneopterin aldolase [Synechococcales cyanobacterium CRU_2_2]|nr:dihydroneopterin aldolase [Synechococcales cyanobacterium CRU_2_2]
MQENSGEASLPAPASTQVLDQLHVNGIRCFGYTGYLPEENKLGQWFEVNLTFWLDLSRASMSDELDDCLDYRWVIETVSELVQTQVFKTVERLAGAIADTLLTPENTSPVESFAKIAQVKVCLTKLAPPIPHFSGQVTVKLTRKRSV